jgi:hypothetical protein
MYALYMFQTVHWILQAVHWMRDEKQEKKEREKRQKQLTRIIVFPFLRLFHPVLIATVPFLACYRLDKSVDLDAWYMLIPFAVGAILYVCLITCCYRPKKSPFYNYLDNILLQSLDLIFIVTTMVLVCFKLSVEDPIHLWVYVAIPEPCCFGIWFAMFASTPLSHKDHCCINVLFYFVYVANFAALLVLGMQMDNHAAHAAWWFISMVFLVPLNVFLYWSSTPSHRRSFNGPQKEAEVIN